MSDYQDKYEEAENGIKLELASASWIMLEISKLIEDYKKCKTENCKFKIEKILRSMNNKLSYENKQLSKIIKKAKDEGIEF